MKWNGIHWPFCLPQDILCRSLIILSSSVNQAIMKHNALADAQSTSTCICCSQPFALHTCVYHMETSDYLKCIIIDSMKKT